MAYRDAPRSSRRQTSSASSDPPHYRGERESDRTRERSRGRDGDRGHDRSGGRDRRMEGRERDQRRPSDGGGRDGEYGRGREQDRNERERDRGRMMEDLPPAADVTAEAIHSNPLTRYFLIKSLSLDNIVRSQEHAVWATSSRNEQRLLSAYETAPYVVLFFSANRSSRFEGYAVMTTRPGEGRKKDVFFTTDGNVFRGNTFGVTWLSCDDVPFSSVSHIRNPLNENHPVKIGRDGQELAFESGRALLEVFEETAPTVLAPNGPRSTDTREMSFQPSSGPPAIPLPFPLPPQGSPDSDFDSDEDSGSYSSCSGSRSPVEKGRSGSASPQGQERIVKEEDEALPVAAGGDDEAVEDVIPDDLLAGGDWLSAFQEALLGEGGVEEGAGSGGEANLPSPPRKGSPKMGAKETSHGSRNRSGIGKAADASADLYDEIDYCALDYTKMTFSEYLTLYPGAHNQALLIATQPQHPALPIGPPPASF